MERSPLAQTPSQPPKSACPEPGLGVAAAAAFHGYPNARGSHAVSYDQANRLKSATVGGTTTTYAYTGDGDRASATVRANPATAYVYDVNGGLPVVLSDGTRTYVYGAGLAYTVDTANTVQVYHTDGLGSVRALTDGMGALIQTYRTDAFGNPTQGTSAQPFGFTGQQRDGNGLVYLRARYYDPASGRFLSRDPLVGALGLPLSLNRYSYALNNPVAETDPSGLSTSRALQDFADQFDCNKHPEHLNCRSPLARTIDGGTVWIPNPGDLSIEAGAKAATGGDSDSVDKAATGGGDESVISALARKIGGGHAWDKHVIEKGEFPGISSKNDFAALIQGVLDKGTGKSLSRGRAAFWDDASKTVVISDPSNPDGGTAFRPANGKSYFKGLK